MKKLIGLLCIAIGVASVSFFLFHRNQSQLQTLFHYKFPSGENNGVEVALQSMEDRVKRLPNDPTDLAALASIYVRKARTTGDFTYYDKAEQTARQSIKILANPNPTAWITLAKVAEARHQFEETIRLSEAVTKEKTSASALGLLITSHLALGHEPEAMQYADLLITKSPGLESYLLRALALAAQGRDEESLFDFQHALSLEDIGEAEESGRVRTLFARFLIKRGRYTEAKILLEESLRIVPQYHLALDWKGELEANLGHYTEAEKLVLQAFTESRQIVYLTHYARIKARHGELKTAEDAWGQAEKMLRQELNTNSFGHRLELVRLLLDRGKKEQGAEALSLAQNEVKVRGNPESLGLLARSFAFLGLQNEARSAILAALRSGIHDADLYQLAGTIEEQIQSKKRAGLYFTLALQTNPRFDDAKKALDRLQMPSHLVSPIQLSESSNRWMPFF